MLRGRCASGELVVLTGFMMPSTHPETNSFMGIYSFASEEIRHDPCQRVIYIDPKTGETVHSLVLENGIGSLFEACYMDRTLDEIRMGGQNDE